MKNKKFWFFGSKLNTALLLILIILMIIALRWMFENKETYLPAMTSGSESYLQNTSAINPNNKQSLQIEGNKEDLISFSILPGSKVHGVMSYRGVIKGGYFFEGNILINILDSNKKTLKSSNAHSTTDWMTTAPVNFEGNIDFTNLPKGPAYIEIHNDNASGLPQNDKSILIPITIL